MIVGETVIQTLYLYDTAGALVTYATKGAMTGAGWDLTWYDNTGTALASQPTWTLPAAGADGRHQIAFVMPFGVWTCKVTLPAAANVAAPTEFGDEGTVFDIDSVGSALSTSTGVAISATSFSQTYEMYDGNSISVYCTIPEAALTALGAASLAALDSIVAEIKINSVDSDNAATVTGLTETITSDSANNRVVLVTLDAFPAALAVPDGGQQSLAATLQVKLTEGTKVLTANSTAMTVRWKATTT